MDNLVLVPENSSYKHYEEPSNKVNREQSLYWIAVQHLLMDSIHQVGRVESLSPRKQRLCLDFKKIVLGFQGLMWHTNQSANYTILHCLKGQY